MPGSPCWPPSCLLRVWSAQRGCWPWGDGVLWSWLRETPGGRWTWEQCLEPRSPSEPHCLELGPRWRATESWDCPKGFPSTECLGTGHRHRQALRNSAHTCAHTHAWARARASSGRAVHRCLCGHPGGDPRPLGTETQHPARSTHIRSSEPGPGQTWVPGAQAKAFNPTGKEPGSPGGPAGVAALAGLDFPAGLLDFVSEALGGWSRASPRASVGRTCALVLEAGTL